MEERRAGTVDQRVDEPNRCSGDVVIWRKSDNDLGARLRLIASSYDELEKARS